MKTYFTNQQLNYIRILLVSFTLLLSAYGAKSQYLGNGTVFTVPDTIYKLRDSVVVNIEYVVIDTFDNWGSPSYITTNLGDPTYFQYLGSVQLYRDSSCVYDTCDIDALSEDTRHGYRFVFSGVSAIKGSRVFFAVDVHYDYPYLTCADAWQTSYYSYFDCTENVCSDCASAPTRQDIISVNDELAFNTIFNYIWTDDWPDGLCDYSSYSSSASASVRQVTVTVLNWYFNVNATEADYIDALNPDSVLNPNLPLAFSRNPATKRCDECFQELLSYVRFIDDSLITAGDPNLTTNRALEGTHNTVLAISGFVWTNLSHHFFCFGNYQLDYEHTGLITNGFEFMLFPINGDLPVIMSQVINDGGTYYSTIAYKYSLEDDYYPPPTGIVYDGSGLFSYTDGFAKATDTTLGGPLGHTIFDTTLYCNAVALIGHSPTTGGVVPYTYTWLPATGLNMPDSAKSTANPLTNATYIRTVSDKYACQTYDTIAITVHHSPVAHAGKDTAIYYGTSDTIGASPAATGGTTPYAYSWSPATRLNSSTTARPIATPDITTAYILTVTDSNLCTAKDTVTITVNPIPTDILARIAESRFIFEGQVTSSTAYWNPGHSQIYTSNTIQITKMLKGSLTCGTVEVITQGGTVDSINETVSNSLALAQGNAGIFLTDTTDMAVSSSDSSAKTNSEKLYPIFEENSLVKYWWDGFEIRVSDMTHVYGTQGEIYTLAELATGYSWTNCSESIIPPVKPHHHRDAPATPFISTYNIQANQNYTNMMNKRRQEINNNPLLRPGVTIDYTMSGATTTGSDVEFDVNVGSPDGNYLNSVVVYLLYDTVKYGTYIASNITVSRWPMIYDDSTYPSISIVDEYSNIVSISIMAGVAVDSATINMSVLNYPAQPLFHVIIPIINCHTNGDISFVDQTDMLGSSVYSEFPDDDTDNTYYFDNISATQTISFTPCTTIQITGFSPNPINGGIGDTLYIRGYEFGSSQGTGNVYFKNADDGGKSQIALDPSDVKWSDTLIKVIVPSLDSTIIGGPLAPPPPCPVGSGTFRVVTDTGLVDSSASVAPFTVFYSITDAATISHGKQYTVLSAPNNNGGYKFYVDTLIWNHPNRLGCVQKALRNWTCLTGVNWQVDSFVVGSQDTTAFDHRNVIRFGKTGTTPQGRELAETKQYNYTSCNVGVCIEIDMLINSSANWSYDTTGASLFPDSCDFIGMLLHELGHAHSLKHVNDPNAIMYYQYAPAGASSSQRKIHLQYDQSCDEGGNMVIYLTGNTTVSCDSTGTPPEMTPEYICAKYNDEVQTILNQNRMVVYPNPADDNVNVDFVVNTENKTEFSLVNMYGQYLLSVEPDNIHTGENMITLNLKNVPSGVYLLRCKINGRLFESKIVHLNDF